jgi:hypothetical protein
MVRNSSVHEFPTQRISSLLPDAPDQVKLTLAACAVTPPPALSMQIKELEGVAGRRAHRKKRTPSPA